MKRTKQENLARQLRATAVAAGAALAASSPAGAAIVTGTVNATVTPGTGTFFLDLDGDNVDDFGFGVFTSSTSSSTSAYVSAQGNNGIFTTSGSFNYAQAFEGSQSVGTGTGSSTNLNGHAVLTSSGSFGNFGGSTPRYLGLRFNATGGNASGFVYGWARVAVPNPGEIRIYDFAYEDSGAPIHVPNEVPEPSTLLLMASGAAGLLALRRRRKS